MWKPVDLSLFASVPDELLTQRNSIENQSHCEGALGQFQLKMSKVMVRLAESQYTIQLDGCPHIMSALGQHFSFFSVRTCAECFLLEVFFVVYSSSRSSETTAAAKGQKTARSVELEIRSRTYFVHCIPPKNVPFCHFSYLRQILTFSKFFHCRILWTVSNNVVVKYSTIL